MGKILIIIPAYNEEKVIGQVIANIKKEGYKNILVVDDGSTDKTSKVARKSGARVLRHFINLGQGAALETGFEFARRKKIDIVVTFDADGQFEAKDIKKVIKPILEKKVDLVLGSRFLGMAINIPITKKIILKLGILFTKIFSGLDLTDTHNGFRAFSKKALEKISITHSRMDHGSDILHQIKEKNLKYVEIPVTVKYTRYSLKKGQSVFNAINIFSKLIFEKLK